MRIDNHTAYPTSLLRRLICRAHNDLAKYEGRVAHWKHAHFVVKRNVKKQYITGYTYQGGRKSVLALPCPTVTPREIYRAAWIRIQFLRGYTLKQLGRPYPEESLVAAAVLDFPSHLREEESVPKAAPDRTVVELARVQARVKAWTTKQKRAETALKKLHRRRKQLEKRLVKPEAP